jgi:hypothetical protein
LQADFPYIPVSHIRIVLFQKNGLYAPAYILLLEQENDPSRPYKRKTRRTAARKGKAVSDPDFDAERAWIVECYHARGTQANATTVVVAEDNEKEDPNALIECGCCFTDYTFVRLKFFLEYSIAIITAVGSNGTMPRCTSFLQRMHNKLRFNKAGI